MIQVENIYKSFNSKLVLQDISFRANQRKIFGLIGPNGSGKTTTIRIILDLLEPDNGKVLLGNKPINAKIKNQIGYLPEERGLYLGSKIKDIIRYFYQMRDGHPLKFGQRLDYWLNKFGLLKISRKKISELSKGNQQLIQFICTVIHDPEIIILDEPFSGIDPLNQRIISDVISELSQKNKIILLSTHILNHAEKLCDELLLLKEGKQIFCGSMRELKEKNNLDRYIISHSGKKEVLNRFGAKIIQHEGEITTIQLPLDILPSKFIKDISSVLDVHEFKKASINLDDIFFSEFSSDEKNN